MHLIIKPTSDCNFNCSFCSARLLKIPTTKNVPEKILQVIDKINPDNITITGGEPLVVDPQYYYQILQRFSGNIGFTSNLKSFVEDPDKWIDLFSNPRVAVCTSFQYGKDRKSDKNSPYDEHSFIQTVSKFKELIGYCPNFIAIINNDNCDRAIDHLYLAKKLQTKCKLNGQNALGLSGEYFPRYKMVDIWLQIYKLRLQRYLMDNCPEITGNCNFNTNLLCESTVRSAWVNVKGDLVYGTCEDLATEGLRLIDLDADDCKPVEGKVNFINENCQYCELCRFCCGCQAHVIQARKCPEYCQQMQKRKKDILESRWVI